MSFHYFGTDGVRGAVGKWPITPDFFLKLGWAVGKVLSCEDKTKVVIGKDTRLSGYMFESALEAGLSAAGVDVFLTGPMPTPAIAYLTRTFNAIAGIVISASHNPFSDNGVKFFSHDGSKLPDSIEQKIEEYIDNKPIIMTDSGKLGKVWRLKDAAGRYIEYCKATISPQLNLKGVKIALDMANGATYHIAPSVFSELGANVELIGNRPNGLNINQGYGSTAPKALQEFVLSTHSDLGIAFDGDGDRVIMVDENGEVLDGDEILFIIAYYQKMSSKLAGGVVGTLLSNIGLNHALSQHNIPFARADVGDRYVNELLVKKKWWLGGEPSGHIICRKISTTGDGIVAALQVLKALLHFNKPLSQLKKLLNKQPQIMVNVALAKKAPNILEFPEVKSKINDSERKLGESGRILIRRSGTEPVVRVMVEGSDQSDIITMAHEIAAIISEKVI